MNAALDPEENHVTFTLKGDGEARTLRGVGPARAVDCIESIWTLLSKDGTARAADVQEVYSEWEPSDEDLAFLDRTFPKDAELGYTFQRPATDAWEQALSEAAKVIAASETGQG